MTKPEMSERFAAECFRRGLVIETAGPRGEVPKLLPPLTIDRAELERGFAIIEAAVGAAIDVSETESALAEST